MMIKSILEAQATPKTGVDLKPDAYRKAYRHAAIKMGIKARRKALRKVH